MNKKLVLALKKYTYCMVQHLRHQSDSTFERMVAAERELNRLIEQIPEEKVEA